MATKEEIVAFQDRIKASFSHNGVVGGRLLNTAMTREEKIGQFFFEKFHGHRLLTDAFLEFFAETLEEQYLINNTKGWPALPHYVTCLLMYLTLFRSIRASEILSTNSYVLKGYALQRGIKDQLYALCGAANAMTTFDDLIGVVEDIEGEQEAAKIKRMFYKKLAVEKGIAEKICGKQSGLCAVDQQNILKWERLFHQEVHRGMLSFWRANHRLLVEKETRLELAPATDDLADAMFVNRAMETNWMAHRLLPFMRRPDTPENNVWNQKWQLLEESFAFMFAGFEGLGKAIAPSYRAMLTEKFRFDVKTYFIEK